MQGKRGEGHLRAVQGRAARFAYRITCRESAGKAHRERCKAGQRALPIGLRVGKARGRTPESGARPDCALCLPDCVQGKREERPQRAVHGQAARFACRIACRESAGKGHRERCKARQRALTPVHRKEPQKETGATSECTAVVRFDPGAQTKYLGRGPKPSALKGSRNHIRVHGGRLL